MFNRTLSIKETILQPREHKTTRIVIDLLGFKKFWQCFDGSYRLPPLGPPPRPPLPLGPPRPLVPLPRPRAPLAASFFLAFDFGVSSMRSVSKGKLSGKMKSLMLLPRTVNVSKWTAGRPFNCNFTAFKWVFMATSTPVIVPTTCVPFFNSTVTVSCVSFIKNLKADSCKNLWDQRHSIQTWLISFYISVNSLIFNSNKNYFCRKTFQHNNVLSLSHGYWHCFWLAEISQFSYSNIRLRWHSARWGGTYSLEKAIEIHM